MSPAKIFTILTLTVAGLTLSSHSFAAITDWQKGASIYPVSSTDFRSQNYKDSIGQLKSVGANYVTLMIPYSQSSGTSSDIQPGLLTPDDESLVAGIQYAHQVGLKVNLNIHLEANGTPWRADINATDRPAWYANYSIMLNRYGEIGRLYNVEMMTIGTELIDMASNYVNPENATAWKQMIFELRKVYPGKLTYSSNWGNSGWNYELGNIGFWPDLDYIGISAYYYMVPEANIYSHESLLAKWEQWNNSHIKPIQQKFGKQVIFTEVGYRSLDTALVRPPDWRRTGPVDEQEQADGYAALFDYWRTQSFMAGVQIWNWKTEPTAGGPYDTDFTPQNKLAQTVIQNWFTGSIPQPTENVIKNTSYLSDQDWVSAINGWGPAEKDLSNGESARNDGKMITLNGQTYAKGLGVHAYSKLDYKLQGCQNFSADVGVDDEIITKGSVVFQVWSGSNKIYDSGLLTYSSPVKTINLGIQGLTQLSLVVTDGGNGIAKDHADWANAKVICESTSPPPPPNPTPTPAPDCNDPAINAWRACYFRGVNLTDLVESKTESSINYNWSINSPSPLVPNDLFSASWNGRYDFNRADYNFKVTADDGFKLYVDGSLILDKWVDQPATTYELIIPVSSGTHSIKLEYFERYGNAVAQLGWTEVTSLPPPTPTPAPLLEIRTPQNNSQVQGTTSFDASITGWPANSYNMYWQVDGDRLNTMYTSTDTNKQAWVDVSGWTWKGNGPYLINFVAKDSNGNVIAQKASTIYIAR